MLKNIDVVGFTLLDFDDGFNKSVILFDSFKVAKKPTLSTDEIHHLLCNGFFVFLEVASLLHKFVSLVRLRHLLRGLDRFVQGFTSTCTRQFRFSAFTEGICSVWLRLETLSLAGTVSVKEAFGCCF